MKAWQNLGTLDRGLRAAAGVVLALLGAFGGFALPWAAVLFVFAALLLGTSAVGFCPAYLPFGLRTFPHTPKAA